MLYLEYLSLSTSLFLQPVKSLDSLFFRHRESLLKYGLLTFILSAALYSTSIILIDPHFSGMSVSQYLINIFFYVLITIVASFLHIALIYLLLGLFNKKVEIKSLAGLFLSVEFPYIVLLPLALIFKAIPFLSSSLFYFIVFILIVFIFYLKVKALVRTTDITEVNAIGLLFLPSILTISLTTISIIALISKLS